MCLMALVSCGKEKHAPKAKGKVAPVLPVQPYNYQVVFPAHFNVPPTSINNSILSVNPVTNEGATLGRVLFYDKALSVNGRISCGSCHKQENGFSDPDQFSTGFNNEITTRNSMAIVNTRFSFRFFWDRRATGLEQQVLMPIQNHIEMGMDLAALESKLADISYYPPLFEAAFGSSAITTERISYALAQFVHSVVTYQSRYDTGLQNGFADFSQLESDGMNLFMSGTVNCNHCHTGANFSDNQGLINGLDAFYVDGGVGDITGNPEDNGRFKVPSLRNIELTAPYMHDGRFTTLEQVIEQYNSGIQPHPYLDDRLASNGLVGGPPKQYNLTAYQKASLVAFLKTLTDDVMISDPKFSDPFPY